MPRCRSLALLALLVACDSAQSPPPPVTPPVAAAPFKLSVTLKQMMAEVVEPAANVYWEAVGTVTDAKGTRETAPQTDSQWVAVRNSATIVAEAGNLMMLEGRARNTDEWMALSRGMIEVAERARAVAEKHDAKAVFDAGAELYEACVACHSIYLVGPKAIPPAIPPE
ncbi:MAG: hypothetical protein IPP90_04885 [Gemmatimonadaceae bacterium]|nr:hypothetical protein [Gemmatimonadaceae bacterium]